MKRVEVYGSGKFLKASSNGAFELPGNPETLTGTIKELSTHTFDDERQQRLVHWTDQTIPTLGLNATNWDTIAKQTGLDDDDLWAGVVLDLMIVPEPKSKTGYAVRVRKARRPGQTESATAPALPAQTPMGKWADALRSKLGGAATEERLRKYLARTMRFAGTMPMENWPRDWSDAIKKWLADPDAAEAATSDTIGADDIPF